MSSIKVIKFKQSLENKALYSEFHNAKTFRDLFSEKLGLWLERHRTESPDELLLAQIKEKLAQKRYNSIEIAEQIKGLCNRGWTDESIAGKIECTRSWVANLRRVLKCPGPVLELLASGHLTTAHALKLLSCRRDDITVIRFATLAHEHNWSTSKLKDEIEAWQRQSVAT